MYWKQYTELPGDFEKGCAGSIMFCSATKCRGSIFGSFGDRPFEFRGFKVSKELNVTANDGKKVYKGIKEEWDKIRKRYEEDDASTASWW